jgi:alkanesulfonate monooxygenase SsuD/methylene tetrahydromethanopterin reductase-like flavin-dependent oxidoreductase (luciferase family)
MTQFGYTGMCEQTPVRQLVSDLQAAEQAGFDFSVISDHYFHCRTSSSPGPGTSCSRPCGNTDRATAPG